MRDNEVVGREYLKRLVDKLNTETKRADEAKALLRSLVTDCTPNQTRADIRFNRIKGVKMPGKVAVENARAFLDRKAGKEVV